MMVVTGVFDSVVTGNASVVSVATSNVSVVSIDIQLPRPLVQYFLPVCMLRCKCVDQSLSRAHFPPAGDNSARTRALRSCLTNS
jgi:hypothetical protein